MIDKKYFFFDIDGTLVDLNNGIDRITTKSKLAMDELKTREHEVLVATGRSICFIPDFVNEYSFSGFVTCNGAYVELNGKSLYKAAISKEAIKEVIEFCQVHDSNYYFESRDNIYIRDHEDEMHKKFIAEWSMKKEVCVDDFDYKQIEVYIGMLVCPDVETLNKARGKLGNYFDLQPHIQEYSCDLTLKGESKGKGIKKLCEHLNVPIDNTIAFGDAYNDFEMIETVGMGIVMGNGVAQLKEIGDYVTETVEQEGIYQALKNHKFI